MAVQCTDQSPRYLNSCYMSSSMTPLGSIELIAAMAVHRAKPTPRQKYQQNFQTKPLEFLTDDKKTSPLEVS